MSSDSELASIAEALQFNNYISLAIVTAVAYDYVITISKEINYIWNRSWSFVTAMFMIVRYLGILIVLIEGLYGSTFIPGPTMVSFFQRKFLSALLHNAIDRFQLDRCTVLLLLSDYAFIVFLAAADMVMILRVYAMYKQSKVVLGLLFVLYVPTIIIYTASAVFYNNPETTLSVSTIQVLDMSLCNQEYVASLKLGKYKVVSRLTLAALLLALAVVRLCWDAYATYKETRRWETNRYIDLFVREGILYFLAHVLNNMQFGENNPGLIVNAIVVVVMFVLSPRFVISVREMHARNLLRPGGWNNGIDTGFGFSRNQPSPAVSNASSVGFARSFGTREESVEMGAV